jgi:hypothetical protein
MNVNGNYVYIYGLNVAKTEEKLGERRAPEKEVKPVGERLGPGGQSAVACW